MKIDRRQFLKVLGIGAAGAAVPLPFVSELIAAAPPPALPDKLMGWREAMLRGAGFPRARWLAIYGAPNFRNDFEFTDNWIIDGGRITYGDKLRMVAAQDCTLQRFEMLLANGEVLYRGTIGRMGADMNCWSPDLAAGQDFVVDYLSLTLLP